VLAGFEVRFELLLIERVLLFSFEMDGFEQVDEVGCLRVWGRVVGEAMGKRGFELV